jgi:hypothetical protein
VSYGGFRNQIAVGSGWIGFALHLLRLEKPVREWSAFSINHVIKDKEVDNNSSRLDRFLIRENCWVDIENLRL